MLLLIDAGNTRIKWAAQVAGQPVGDWFAMGSVTHAGLAGLAAQWQALSVDQVLISNVAGEQIAAQLTQQLTALQPVPPSWQWFRSVAHCAGVLNAYREPQQLGSDRFASLIGARHLFANQPLLVVTCGTATTIDALDADGRFAGGMILPGLATMAQSLALNTAQLPAIAELHFAHLFADNTQDAIISGCMSAQVGAISLALTRRAGPPARCILSGGAASFIAPHLPGPCERVDNLVLIGLAAAFAAQQRPAQ